MNEDELTLMDWIGVTFLILIWLIGFAFSVYFVFSLFFNSGMVQNLIKSENNLNQNFSTSWECIEWKNISTRFGNGHLRRPFSDVFFMDWENKTNDNLVFVYDFVFENEMGREKIIKLNLMHSEHQNETLIRKKVKEQLDLKGIVYMSDLSLFWVDTGEKMCVKDAYVRQV